MEGAVLKAILHATRIVQPVGIHRGVSLRVAAGFEGVAEPRKIQNGNL